MTTPNEIPTPVLTWIGGMVVSVFTVLVAHKTSWIPFKITLGSGADTIKMKVEPSSRACADNDAAPATINVTGKAIITGGTGKYAKASGTLKASGNFYVKAMTAGSTDSPSFTMSLSGTIATK